MQTRKLLGLCIYKRTLQTPANKSAVKFQRCSHNWDKASETEFHVCSVTSNENGQIEKRLRGKINCFPSTHYNNATQTKVLRIERSQSSSQAKVNELPLRQLGNYIPLPFNSWCSFDYAGEIYFPSRNYIELGGDPVLFFTQILWCAFSRYIDPLRLFMYDFEHSLI